MTEPSVKQCEKGVAATHWTVMAASVAAYLVPAPAKYIASFGQFPTSLSRALRCLLSSLTAQKTNTRFSCKCLSNKSGHGTMLFCKVARFSASRTPPWTLTYSSVHAISPGVKKSFRNKDPLHIPQHNTFRAYTSFLDGTQMACPIDLTASDDDGMGLHTI